MSIIDQAERQQHASASTPVFNVVTGRFDNIASFKKDGLEAAAARQKQFAQIDPKIAQLEAELAHRKAEAQWVTMTQVREGDFDVVTKVDQRTGHRWREFHGDIADMLKHFSPSGGAKRFVRDFMTPYVTATLPNGQVVHERWGH